MALFSPTPVLSVVVPHLGNEHRFETSLISVLENRPRRCEVVVCHDGSYSDPFDLGDEVRFVVSQANDLPAQVVAAAESAKGRLLHVLCDGQRATDGWTDAALDCFDDPNVAAVSPSISDANRKTTAAIGWTRTAGSLMAPVAAGKRSPSRRDRAAVQGAYLSASFWRTGVVRELAALPTSANPHVAVAVWTAACQAAGLCCHAETASQIIAGEDFAAAIKVTAATARHLQSIAITTRSQSAVQGALIGWLTNLHRPAAWGSACGRLSAAWSDSAFQRSLREILPGAVSALRATADAEERPATLKMPFRPTATNAPIRRAA